MNHWIEPVNVLEAMKTFCMMHKEDETAVNLILDIGAELLDVSQDTLVNMMEEDICSYQN